MTPSDGRPRPVRPTQSRFTGARAFAAPWYAALWPGATPLEVDLMTPSQIASVLGLDREDAVKLVPVEEAEFTALSGDGEQRIRTVM